MFGKTNTKKVSFFRQYAIFIALIVIACIIFLFVLVFCRYSAQADAPGHKRPVRPTGMKPVSTNPSSDKDESTLNVSLKFTNRLPSKAIIPSVIRLILHVRQLFQEPRIVNMARLETYFLQNLDQPFDCNALDNILYFIEGNGYCMWDRSALTHLGYDTSVVTTEDEMYLSHANFILVDSWSASKFLYGTSFTSYSGDKYKAIAVAVRKSFDKKLGPYMLYLRAPEEDTWKMYDDEQEPGINLLGIADEKVSVLKATTVLYYKLESAHTNPGSSKPTPDLRLLQDKLNLTYGDQVSPIVPSIIRYVQHVRECLGPAIGENRYKYSEFYKPTPSNTFDCKILENLLLPPNNPGPFIWDNDILQSLGYNIMYASNSDKIKEFDSDLVRLDNWEEPRKMFACRFVSKKMENYSAIAFAVKKPSSSRIGAYELYLRYPTQNYWRLFDDSEHNTSSKTLNDVYSIKADMVLYQKIQ